MRRPIRGHRGWFGGAAASALLLACTGSNEARSSGTPAERAICPQCQPAFGGETSDFGDGSAYLPTAAGSTLALDPCTLIEQAVAIDVDSARRQGFGRILDQLTRSFELPFQWAPYKVNWGGSASGYTPSTRISGATEVISLEHLVLNLEGCEDRLRARGIDANWCTGLPPDMALAFPGAQGAARGPEGCQDRLRARVATALEWEDGALSVRGELQTTVLRSTERANVYGNLDLSGARGTLELHPPSDADSLVGGAVQLSMYLWPEEVRMAVDVIARAKIALPDGLLAPAQNYHPLAGRAPVDVCATDARPLALDEPATSAGGVSLSESYQELLTLLALEQPKPAHWSTGGDTSVTFAAGEPFDACETSYFYFGGRLEEYGVQFMAPYRVDSADGRVDIASDAHGYLSVFDGAVIWGGFNIPTIGEGESRDTFPSNSGISGIDFGEASGAVWETSLSFDLHRDPPVQGELVVVGVDFDNRVPGQRAQELGELDRLSW